MRGTPNGTQDDLSGKRAPGAAPRPRVTSQTCVPFAKGRNRAIGNLSRPCHPRRTNVCASRVYSISHKKHRWDCIQLQYIRKRRYSARARLTIFFVVSGPDHRPRREMETFTSLLSTRSLERESLIILPFVQRLLVRDHYLQVLALKLRMSLSSTQRVSL